MLAADLVDARLLTVSAGLGLVWADTRVPPYACTVLVGAPDSIASRVTVDYAVAGWWQALTGSSPFSQSLAGGVPRPKGSLHCPR